MRIITNVAWDRVRDQFSEDEKEQLRAVATSQSICPAGTIIDEESLGKDLRAKIERLTKPQKGDPLR